MFNRILLPMVLAFSAMGLLFASDFELEPMMTADAEVAIQIDDATFGNDFVAVGEIARPASICAGGGKLFLDVSNNEAAEKELIRHSILTHGDGRQRLVSIKGKLEFRPVKNDPDAKVRPVIIVKSLKVRLGYPGDQTGAPSRLR